MTTHPQIEWGIGIISEKIIDRINILEATKLAIAAAVHDLQKKLGKAPDILLLDGNFTVDVPIAQKTFVKGDTFIFSCSAASIIAKVTRDRLMKQYHSKYPAYRFDSHKGYGTKLHYEMLNTYGPCPLHRKTFRPVYQLLNNLENPDIVKKHS
ncbi:MAG: ribonuclease HII [Candidatus Wildermuthbacteria bacterium]|nr:ribonuclease HII [Candidatus Wildermuthbacteria bacterium]